MRMNDDIYPFCGYPNEEVHSLYVEIERLALEWIGLDAAGRPGKEAVVEKYHEIVRQIETLTGDFNPGGTSLLPVEHMPEPYRSNMIRRLLAGDVWLVGWVELPDNYEQYLQGDQQISDTNLDES